MGPSRRLIFLLLGAGVACSLPAQDHVGKPVPEFTTGDECLFCHRVKVADSWQANPHARTIRPADSGHVVGARTHSRELKQEGYGRFALRSMDKRIWDKDKFANRCAGCHATAVDPATKAFAAFAIDCYACHGVANPNHGKDKSLMWLSSKHERDPKLITSICGQCHLRGGESKSSGLPYSNNFVVGDNLFQDFQVDLKLAADLDLNAGDRHVYENVRDVLENYGTVTCLSCHQIHGDNTQKHRRVLSGPICLECHNESGPKKAAKPYVVHSPLCEY